MNGLRELRSVRPSPVGRLEDQYAVARAAVSGEAPGEPDPAVVCRGRDLGQRDRSGRLHPPCPETGCRRSRGTARDRKLRCDQRQRDRSDRDDERGHDHTSPGADLHRDIMLPMATETRSERERSLARTGDRAPASWGLGDGQAVPWEYAPAPESRDVVTIKDRYGLFIGGREVESSDGATFVTVNPATE